MKKNKNTAVWFGMTLFAAGGTLSHGAMNALSELKITEVVNEVNVMDTGTRKTKRVQAQETFRAAEVLSTGAASRAELVAADGTVARVGANSIFSVASEKREVSLEKGSVMFQSPKGRGGGVIRSASATASVIGTSLIVTATQNGGFKMLVLEGKAMATLPGGGSSILTAGQMTFVLPGSKAFGPVINFRLKDQVGGSSLVKGFKSELPAGEKITSSVAAQEQKISAGKVEVTNLVIADTKVFAAAPADSTLVQTRTVVVAEAKKQAEVAKKAELEKLKASIPKVVVVEPVKPVVVEPVKPVVVEPTTPVGLTLDQALATDVSIVAGVADPRHIFKFANSSTPASLLSLHGAEAAAAIPGYIGSRYYFVGKNINVTGGVGDDFLGLLGTPGPVVFAAQDSFTMNEGLPASHPDIITSWDAMESLLANSDTAETMFWVVAGKSVSVSNTLLKSTAPVLALGNAFYEAYPDVNVSIKDSAILGGLDKSYGDASSQTSVYAGGSRVSVTNTNVVTTGDIMVRAGQIDIASDSPAARDFIAGYSAAYDSMGPRSSSSIDMKAAGDMNVTNMNMDGSRVNLDARTINLTKVDFRSGTDVTLISGLGRLADNPNTNAPSVPRKVNFIRDVTYGGVPAQQFVSTSVGGSATGPSQVKIKIQANGR